MADMKARIQSTTAAAGLGVMSTNPNAVNAAALVPTAIKPEPPTNDAPIQMTGRPIHSVTAR